MSDPALTPPAPAAPRRSRWLVVALVASLALNAFVIGVVAGRSLRDGPSVHGGPHAFGPPGRGGSPPVSFRGFVRILPHSARHKLRQTADSHRLEMAKLIKAAVAARLDVGKALAAAEFDRAQLEGLLARSRAADEAVKARAHQIIAEAAAGFSKRERAAIQRLAARRMVRWRRRAEWRRRWRERWANDGE